MTRMREDRRQVTFKQSLQVEDPERLEWFGMTPTDRWRASMALWPAYRALGGSLEPEVDLQSPFWSADDYRQWCRPARRSRTIAANQVRLPDAAAGDGGA